MNNFPYRYIKNVKFPLEGHNAAERREIAVPLCGFQIVSDIAKC